MTTRKEVLPEFNIVFHPHAPAEVVWSRIWDLDRHTAAVPFTTARSFRDEPLRLGSRFMARTGGDLLHFDDRMVVREWEPYHHAVIEKIGPGLRGIITVKITDEEQGCRVDWTQSYSVDGIPNKVAALFRPIVRLGYLSSLRTIVG